LGRLADEGGQAWPAASGAARSIRLKNSGSGCDPADKNELSRMFFSDAVERLRQQTPQKRRRAKGSALRVFHAEPVGMNEGEKSDPGRFNLLFNGAAALEGKCTSMGIRRACPAIALFFFLVLGALDDRGVRRSAAPSGRFFQRC